MTPREDELYGEVIEIARKQAESQTAMAELHRQNVAKQDTMATLLSAQTTSLVGVSNALSQMNEARTRSDRAAEVALAAAVKEVKEHVDEVTNARWDRMERKFWIGIVIIALTGSSDTVVRLLGVLKG